MKCEDFVNWLKNQRGVTKVEAVPGELADAVSAEESTVVSAMGTDVDNSGLRDCLERNSLYVAFVRGNFWQPPTETMFLKNSEGEIIGHDIPACRIGEYQSRDDVMFISDDFIMYTGGDLGDMPVMEMVSQSYRGEDGSLPDETDAVLWFPSPSSNDMIHGEFGVPLEDLATALIGINLERCGSEKL